MYFPWGVFTSNMGFPYHPLGALILEFKELWRKGTCSWRTWRPAFQWLSYVSEYQPLLGTFHNHYEKKEPQKSNVSQEISRLHLGRWLILRGRMSRFMIFFFHNSNINKTRQLFLSNWGEELMVFIYRLTSWLISQSTIACWVRVSITEWLGCSYEETYIFCLIYSTVGVHIHQDH